MSRKRLIILGCVLAGILILALPVSNLFIESTPTPKFLAIQATSPAMEQAIKLNFDICRDKTEPQKLSLRYPVAKYQLRCTTYAIE